MNKLSLRAAEPHIVGRQTIAVTTQNMADLGMLQPKIARLNVECFEPIIAEVFDEFGYDADDLTLDRVTLDLGNFSLENLDAEAGERLRTELRRALNAQLSSVDVAPKSSSAQVDAAKPDIASLEQFLRTGRNPLRSREGQRLSLSELLQEEMSERPIELVKLLLRIGNMELSERLVREVNSAVLYRLTKLLDPRNAAEMLMLSGAVVSAYEESPEKKSSPYDFNDLVWGLVFQYLLVSQQTEFNRQMFVGAILEAMARKLRIEFHSLVEIIRAGLEELEGRRPARTSLPSILRQISRRKEGADPASALPEPARAEQLHHRPGMPMGLAKLLARLPVGARETIESLLTSDKSGQSGKDAAIAPNQHLDRAFHSLAQISSEHELRQLFARFDRRTLRASLIRLSEATSRAIIAVLVAASRDKQSAISQTIAQYAEATNHKAVFFAELIVAAVDQRQLDIVGISAAADAKITAEPADDPAASEILLRFLKTGRIKLADQDRVSGGFGGDFDNAVQAYLRTLPKGSTTVSTVREAAVRGQTSSGYIKALRPETLAPMIEAIGSVSGIASCLAAAEHLLKVEARRAGLAADRTATLLEEFWQYQFISAGDRQHLKMPAPTLLAKFLKQHELRQNGPTDQQHGSLYRSVEASALRETSEPVESAKVDQLNTAVITDELVGNAAGFEAGLEAAWRSLDKNVRLQIFAAEWMQNVALRADIRRMSAAKFDRLMRDLGLRFSRPLPEQADVLFMAARRAVGRAGKNKGLKQDTAAREFLVSFLIGADLPSPSNRISTQVQVGRLLAFFVQSQMGGAKGASKRPSMSKLRRGAMTRDVTFARFVRELRRIAKNRGFAMLVRSLNRLERIGLDRLLVASRANDIQKLPIQSNTVQPSAPDKQRLSSPDTAAQSATPIHHSGKERERKMTNTTETNAYVDNAGLVLAGPFLPHLFASLDMLTTDDDGKQAMRDEHAFSRAVHLTQRLVVGSSDSPEHLLALNKLLCGGQIDSAVEAGIVLTDREVELCDSLLAAMLANWPALSGTSVSGLQETFMQRSGHLSFDGSKWDLKVERKTLDILLDQTSWGFRTLDLPWQQNLIQVEW